MSEFYKSLREKLGSELLMMPAVAAVIHDEQGRVLMLRHHSDGKWSLPAGAVELEAVDGEALEFGWFDPFDPPSMGLYYLRDILAQRPLGPPPDYEALARDFDLPDDAMGWGNSPMGICSTCALRFRGLEYAEDHRIGEMDIEEHYARTGELTGSRMERWVEFFRLQRGLGGRGLERSHENSYYYRAFYDLFLDLYDTEIPAEYVRWGYEEDWRELYVPKIDDCVAYIKRVRAEMGS